MSIRLMFYVSVSSYVQFFSARNAPKMHSSSSFLSATTCLNWQIALLGSTKPTTAPNLPQSIHTYSIVLCKNLMKYQTLLVLPEHKEDKSLHFQLAYLKDFPWSIGHIFVTYLIQQCFVRAYMHFFFVFCRFGNMDFSD